MLTSVFLFFSNVLSKIAGNQKHFASGNICISRADLRFSWSFFAFLVVKWFLLSCSWFNCMFTFQDKKILIFDQFLAPKNYVPFDYLYALLTSFWVHIYYVIFDHFWPHFGYFFIKVKHLWVIFRTILVPYLTYLCPLLCLSIFVPHFT